MVTLYFATSVHFSLVQSLTLLCPSLKSHSLPLCWVICTNITETVFCLCPYKIHFYVRGESTWAPLQCETYLAGFIVLESCPVAVLRCPFTPFPSIPAGECVDHLFQSGTQSVPYLWQAIELNRYNSTHRAQRVSVLVHWPPIVPWLFWR